MLPRLQKGAEDGIALRRVFQAYTFEVTEQDRLRLADHLARDGGLIVNALLQHDLC